jgi:hypothetical protein
MRIGEMYVRTREVEILDALVISLQRKEFSRVLRIYLNGRLRCIDLSLFHFGAYAIPRWLLKELMWTYRDCEARTAKGCDSQLNNKVMNKFVRQKQKTNYIASYEQICSAISKNELHIGRKFLWYKKRTCTWVQLRKLESGK